MILQGKQMHRWRRTFPSRYVDLWPQKPTEYPAWLPPYQPLRILLSLPIRHSLTPQGTSQTPTSCWLLSTIILWHVSNHLNPFLCSIFISSFETSPFISFVKLVLISIYYIIFLVLPVSSAQNSSRNSMNTDV